jgi:hydroxymethylglutaryl-CoA synthase
VDVELFRVRDGVARMRTVPSVEDDAGRARADTPYLDFLAWRGELTRERPRRPDPPRPAAPPSRRSERWKFGLIGSRCTNCAATWAPPQRKCASCGAQDEMVEAPIGELEGTVATFTLDHLAFSPQPPIVAAAVDLDGGGRLQCQLTDVAPEDVAVGDRVAMTFRRLFTTDGVHNYFWKARPAVTRGGEER